MFLENSTLNFKTPSIQYLSHIIHQIKLLGQQNRSQVHAHNSTKNSTHTNVREKY
jgi:hypothetical protein